MFTRSHIPNAICLARILLTVPIVWLLVNAEYRTALILIIVAGFSDALDGFLAKRFGWSSRIGGLLDPLADKLLFVSVFSALTWTGLVPLWLFAVVVVRDIVIVSGALSYEKFIAPVEPRPTKVGKLNTVTALLYLFFVIAHQVYAWPEPIVLLIAGAMVFVLSLVSGLHYVLSWSRLALEANAR